MFKVAPADEPQMLILMLLNEIDDDDDDDEECEDRDLVALTHVRLVNDESSVTSYGSVLTIPSRSSHRRRLMLLSITVASYVLCVSGSP